MPVGVTLLLDRVVNKMHVHDRGILGVGRWGRGGGGQTNPCPHVM